MKSRIAERRLIEFAKSAPSAPMALTRKKRALIRRTLNAPHAPSVNLASIRRNLAQKTQMPYASHARVVMRENMWPACVRLLRTHNVKRAKFAKRDNTFLLLVTERKTQLVLLARHLVMVTNTKHNRVVELKIASALPVQLVMLTSTRLALVRHRTTALAKLARSAPLEVSSSSVALETKTRCAKNVQSAPKAAIKSNPVELLLTPDANCARNAKTRCSKLRLALAQQTANAKLVPTVLMVRTELLPVLGRMTLSVQLAPHVLLGLTKFRLAPRLVTEFAKYVRHLAKKELTKQLSAQRLPTEFVLLAQRAKMASTS